jgi:hypothetical protein
MIRFSTQPLHCDDPCFSSLAPRPCACRHKRARVVVDKPGYRSPLRREAGNSECRIERQSGLGCRPRFGEAAEKTQRRREHVRSLDCGCSRWRGEAMPLPPHRHPGTAWRVRPRHPDIGGRVARREAERGGDSLRQRADRLRVKCLATLETDKDLQSSRAWRGMNGERRLTNVCFKRKYQ